MEKKSEAESKKKSVEQLKKELADCIKKRDEYLDGWKRARAEFSNYKKQEAERFEAIIRTANKRLIEDLVRVLDSFDMGLQALEKEGKAEKGMYLIRAQLEDVLKSYGLERMIVTVGQKFDPNLHDAVAIVESDQEEGTIVEEVERGYLLHGKLLRSARVKVAKGKKSK